MNYQQQQQQQQQQIYDPSSQYYHQPTPDYSYSYPYPNYSYNIQPIPYPNAPVQPQQHAEQEPNPPGVPAPVQAQTSYYQYPAPTPAVVNVGQHYQPIVQSSYGGIGGSDVVQPQESTNAHFGPTPNVVVRPIRGRGRGRGRGQGRAQGVAHIQGRPQPMPQYSSSLGSVLMPFQGQSYSAPVPPKVVSCELCKVDCNTLEVLEQHRNGKKHKKNLKVFEESQKRKESVIFKPIEQTSTSELRPEVQQESLPSQVVNEENKVEVEKQMVEEEIPTEESLKNGTMDSSEGRGCGIKRKMRGGKAGRKIKPRNGSKRPIEPPKPKEVIPLICELCNVKCESLVVFQSHLMGKKHQSNAKRFMGNQEILGQEILKALSPAIQALLCQQNLYASTSVAPQLYDQGLAAFQGAFAQTLNAINLQVSGTTGMEAISQAQPISANFVAPHLVNAEGKSNEGHAESQGEMNHPSSSVAAQMENVPSQTEPVTSGIAVGGASVVEQSVVYPSFPGQYMSEGGGGGSAQ